MSAGPGRRLRLGPPPSWPAPPWARVIRWTLICSLVGLILGLLDAWGRSVNVVPVVPGAYAAAWMLFRRWIRIWVIFVSGLLATILAAALWFGFDSAHVLRWAPVAVAAVCPISVVAVARLLTFIGPVTLVARQPGSPPAMAQDWQPHKPLYATNPSAPPPPDDQEDVPPLPADFI
jgi:hypothetical protein